MSVKNKNTALVRHSLEELWKFGVREVCVCASSRNAPLVAGLKANPDLFKIYYFFEERSASFFALGRIRLTGAPVAISATSGTAIGEMLPAVMEAHYSGVPLVVLSADRPRTYRGSGAPQSAEQVGIFGIFVSECIDLEGDERRRLDECRRDLPLQLNLCFFEPLLDSDMDGQNPYRLETLESEPKSEGLFQPDSFRSQLDSASMKEFLTSVSRPLVVVGALAPEDREGVAQLLLRWKAPVYCEGLSGLREDSRLNSIRIRVSDFIFERAARADYQVDGLVRIGGVPTLRPWRDLELAFSHLKVLSISNVPFSGLGRRSTLFSGSIRQLCLELEDRLESLGLPAGPSTPELLIQQDRALSSRLDELLASEPTSEPGMVARLSSLFQDGSRVYLGNSMPIREWDLAASTQFKGQDVWASRGLNGIDGQVSTFFGYAKQNAENWAIIGDLTALYDLPAPWILPQLSETCINLVVINNGGGKIFSRLFPGRPEFQNQHQLKFKGWAELWNLEYVRWTELGSSLDSSGSGRNRLIELVPDDAATQRFWKQYSEFLNQSKEK